MEQLPLPEDHQGEQLVFEEHHFVFPKVTERPQLRLVEREEPEDLVA